MTRPAPDPFALSRFVDAQAPAFARAMDELAASRKQSHWMWFVFPQIAGLGRSATARRFAIASRDEARAYLAHPVLGPRLLRAAALAAAASGDAPGIFGAPDDLKLRSSMTLFAAVADDPAPFQAVLDRFWDGAPCARTLEILDQP